MNRWRIPRAKLFGVRDRQAPDGLPFVVSDAPPGQKNEKLYRAIERAQAFLRGCASEDGAMETLRRRYPSPRFFVESDRRSLTDIGLTGQEAFYYSLIPRLTRTSLSQQWGARPRLNTLASMSAYAETLFIGMHVECFYLILLNRRAGLIRSVLLQRGSVDNAPFYLGQVLAEALREGAGYLVLAHNHPGGTRFPSREDVACTQRALNACAPLGILLLDHLIVAGSDVISIRGSGVIPATLWNQMAPAEAVARRWLETT